MGGVVDAPGGRVGSEREAPGAWRFGVRNLGLGCSRAWTSSCASAAYSGIQRDGNGGWLGFLSINGPAHFWRVNEMDGSEVNRGCGFESEQWDIHLGGGVSVSLAQRVSAYNRDRKWRLFVRMVEPGPETRILDVGFSEREYSSVDNYLERHYPWPEMITALGLNEAVEFRRRYPRVRPVRYDGKIFPFPDQAFDVVWSNAVIEHVGNFDRQVLFVKEMVRVGRRVFFTTPNRWFPIELHTRLPLVHWLPKPICDRWLRRLGHGPATGDYMHLLGRTDLQRVLRAAGVDRYRIIVNRLAGWGLDFVVLTEAAGEPCAFPG